MTPFLRAAMALVLILEIEAAPIKIACIGDSITEGSGLANPGTQSYPARLQRLLGTNYTVRNFGLGGRTLLKQADMPYWKESYFKQSHDFYPDIVIIQLGTNDSKPQNWRYGTNFVANYEEFAASYATLSNAPAVYICTPCPVYGAGAYDIRPGIIATNIAPAVRDISQRVGYNLIDLHKRMAGHAEWFPDTVHPNSRGMAVMAAVMFNAVKPSGATNAPAASLAVRRLPSNRVELSWPGDSGNLVPQSTTPVTGTNWLVVDAAIPYSNNAGSIQLTNSSAGIPRFFRLWQP
jgi:acyl-CoA thioesterase I